MSMIESSYISIPQRPKKFHINKYDNTLRQLTKLATTSMTRFNRAFFLLGQAVQDISQVPADGPIENFRDRLTS